MQIKGLEPKQPSLLKQGTLKTDSGRADAIDDLFNNSPKQEDNPSIKLRLSKTLQYLQQGLSDEVKSFLKENKEMRLALEEVELPKSEYTQYTKGADFTLRKLKSYLSWKQIASQETQSTGHPFEKIKELEKNGEIEEMFGRYDKKLQDVLEQRRKNNPNYFYLFFPETYTFN